MARSCKDTCVVCREQRVTEKESGMKRILLQVTGVSRCSKIWVGGQYMGEHIG